MTEIPLTLFADSSRAQRSLTALHELFINAGCNYPVEEFSQALSSALEHSPDSDLALTNMLRFAEATMSKSSLLNDLVKHAMLMDVLMKMLAYSQYFADILVRDPELFRWLTASDALVNPRRREFLQEEVGRVMKMFQKPERKLDGLKRLYRREILRIGARDILGESNLATTTEELSHLADSLADAACAVAHQQLSERFPQQPQTPYAVIGLGKLGGAELNYSSDVDIIFVYKEEGELADAKGKARTYHEYFNAFVEKLVVNLSQSSVEGHLYRVDTRLRPESGAGPLARSIASYLLYYESRGELWERQMLIKARPIAGDIEFGEGFLKQLEPFVYPRTFLQNPKEYIAKIKARIEAAIVGEENVKLRAGGIRDIEFIAQALQLINGGKNKAIRSRNSLIALQQLSAQQFLSEEEARLLSDAYVFFRTIEHRLQTMLNLQTHEIPKDERTLTILAKKVGLQSADELRKKSGEYLVGVRRIFENVLETDTTKTELNLASVLEGNVGVDAIAKVVATFGFSDARKAAKNVATMISGSALLETKELDMRARNAFKGIAEPLLNEIARSPSPDMTLHNISLIAIAQKFPEQFYNQLREPQFRNLVLTVCAKSPRFAKGLAKNPLVLETLANDPHSFTRTNALLSPAIQNVAEWKRSGELRAGIRFVLGVTTFDEMSEELSLLADGIVTTIVKEELKSAKLKKAPLALLALGKYGTREINFDSDLDVLFIADAPTTNAKDKLEKVATKIVNRFSSFSEDGKLYDLDARLRPEGRSAPLVVDRKAYLAYLSHRASLWERQSLTRLRFVAGDEKLGSEVLTDVHAFVYESALPTYGLVEKNWAQEIVTMRKKTETRSKVSGSEFLDVKLSAGGMVDVEFLSQMVQLKFGAKDKMLRNLATANAIRSAPLSIEKEELVEAYALFRKTETLLRISLEERGTIVPQGEKLEMLAKLLDFSDGQEMHRQLLSTMRNVRQLFVRVAEGM